jgi:FkbM family methyltransferase
MKRPERGARAWNPRDERMPALRAVARALVRRLPIGELLFRTARKIVDRYNGDGDFDMRTNGELWLLRALLPGARTVLDVGAHHGAWALAAHAVNPDAHIHCFEPSARTFRLLERQAARPNLVLNPFGLSDRDDERVLWVYAEGSEANSLYRRVGTLGEQRDVETVRMRTLDGYCAERGLDSVDLAKVDVEGHELAVFRGAERMLRRSRVGAVQFEYNDTYIDARTQLRDVWQFVAGVSADYAFYKLYPRELRHVPAYTQRHETFRYSNWVVLRRDVAASLGGPA